MSVHVLSVCVCYVSTLWHLRQIREIRSDKNSFRVYFLLWIVVRDILQFLEFTTKEASFNIHTTKNVCASVRRVCVYVYVMLKVNSNRTLDTFHCFYGHSNSMSHSYQSIKGHGPVLSLRISLRPLPFDGVSVV